MQPLTILLLFASYFNPAVATTTLSLPSCAIPCYTTALSNTTCSTTDFYCQCTSPNAAIIQARAIPCLCHSDCSTTELLQVVQDSDQICSSAVAAHGGAYTASSIGLGVCATAAAGVASSSGTTATTTVREGLTSSSSVGGAATRAVNFGGGTAAAVVVGWAALAGF